MKIFLLLILTIPRICYAEEEKSSITIEEFLEGLSSVKGVTQRRDPFDPVKPPFAESTDTEEDLSTSPFLRYQVESYTVVAIIAGSPNRISRALIRAPVENALATFEATDRLGNRGGRIVEVNKGGIVVVQNQRTPLGFIDRARITLTLASAGAQNPNAKNGKAKGGESKEGTKDTIKELKENVTK